MKFPIACITIAVLVVLVFDRVSNKGDNTSNPTTLVDPSFLNDSITTSKEPLGPRAIEPDDINPALGAIFDPNYFAGTVLWEMFIKKGRHLDCLMRASDEAAGWLMQDTRHPPSAASRWKGNLAFDMRKWYWHQGDVVQGEECDFRAYGLEDVFEGLGLDPGPMWDEEDESDDGENDCITMIHGNPDEEAKPVYDQEYQVDGRNYRATGGQYTFAINQEDGAIIAINVLSPRVAVQKPYNWGRPAQPGELPELQALSDIYWGFYSFENPNVKKFRVYGAQSVVNSRTVLLVTRAMRNVRKFAPEIWPGTTFWRGTDEFLALIGSPIGATACHFLIGHKAELGLKYITRVIVVCDGNDQEQCTRINRRLHLFFIIEDVPFQGMGWKREDMEVGETRLAESHVLYTRDEGRHVLREHKIMANP